MGFVQKVVTVTFKEFSCKLEGFDDPLAVLPEVLKQLVRAQPGDEALADVEESPPHVTAPSLDEPLAESFEEMVKSFAPVQDEHWVELAAISLHHTEKKDIFTPDDLKGLLKYHGISTRRVKEAIEALLRQRIILQMEKGRYLLSSIRRGLPATWNLPAPNQAD